MKESLNISCETETDTDYEVKYVSVGHHFEQVTSHLCEVQILKISYAEELFFF